MARDNRTLGRFNLVGLPPAPRGTPQIEVAFDIDANGILNVSAKDVATGRQQQITITASSGLSKQDVERMVREAEANAGEDARRRQEIELRNQTDALVYSTERALAEHGARLSAGERGAVDQALAEAREALSSEDAERLRRAQEGLTRASQTLAAAAQRQGGEASGPSAAPPGGAAREGMPREGEIVDAEFEDIDDERKAS
jgi:molecular chaperone DnaK